MEKIPSMQSLEQYTLVKLNAVIILLHLYKLISNKSMNPNVLLNIYVYFSVKLSHKSRYSHDMAKLEIVTRFTYPEFQYCLF